MLLDGEHPIQKHDAITVLVVYHSSQADTIGLKLPTVIQWRLIKQGPTVYVERGTAAAFNLTTLKAIPVQVQRYLLYEYERKTLR